MGGLVVFAAGGGLVLSQAAPDGPIQWLNYGVLGLVVVSLLVGWFVPAKVHEREIARADRLEAELARRDAYIAEEVVPALTRATDALSSVSRRDGPGG